MVYSVPNRRLDLITRLFNAPYVLLIIATVFWAGNLIMARAIRLDVPPIGLAFWRWFLGFCLIARFALPHLKTDWPVICTHWTRILLFSGVGLAAFPVLLYVGVHSTTALNASIIQSLMPLSIMAMSYLLFRDRISIVQAMGLGLGLGGAIAIVTRGDWHVLTTLSLNIGDVLILLGIIGYGLYSALLRLRPVIHPLSFLAITFAMAAGLLFPLYLGETLAGQPMRFDPVTVLTVSYSSIFPSIVSQLFFNRGVELVGANRAGFVGYLLPIFSSLMAIAFLGEQFQPFHLAGMGLIVLGILLVTQGKHT